MARGKFNKRGGGKRVDAQSAEEIEQRNQRLAEFEEQRAQRRAEEAEDGDEEAAEEDAAADKPGSKPKEEPEKGPVRVTTDEEHKRNLAKLEAVRKRREEAEKRRKADEEAATALEAERAMKAATLQDSDDDSDDGKKKKKKSKAKAIPKLTKIEIKKMKPAQMKEALKERDLDIQGNAKTLTQRLLDYEAAR